MFFTKIRSMFTAASIVVLLLLPALANAQSNDNTLSPLEVAKLQKITEVTISPTGNKIAYTVKKQADPRDKNTSAKNHLFLLDLKSGKMIPFIKTMDVSDINFRPQKHTITFLGKRKNENSNALMEIPISGGHAETILSMDSSIEGYSWAPDGDHLAFMAADTSQRPETSLPYEPRVYEENLKQRRGYIINIAKRDSTPVRQVPIEGSIYQMVWSPDGSKLALAVAPTPKIDDFYMSQQVLIVGSDSSKVLGEVDHRGKLDRIAWSPNGQKLAMLGAANINDPTSGRLLIVSAEGGKPTQLQPQYNGKFEQFVWSDSTSLRYISSEGLWTTYGSINADGSNMQAIIDRGGPSLEHFAQANDSTVVFIADSSAHPNELYEFEAQDSTLSRITHSNKWLDSVSLGAQKAVSWKAQDGTKIQGTLIYPVNYDQNKLYPLIVSAHGGPESHYNNGWLTSYFEPGQVAAGQGYFIFYPNYRGSTGRGEAFVKSSQADLAGAEFDDILSGVDELIKAGIVDSSRVGITGGSYGGYATGWMSTRYTKRFAAGVMFAGVSNNISKWGTSDIPKELFLVHARECIWNDYGAFLKSSPIYYAGQAQTPLLIAAGTEDTRVNPSQSIELYRHIKTRTDTPVRLLLYPNEGHGNSNSTARYDYNRRMMQWFNTYLKGEEQEKPDAVLDPKKG